MRTPSVLRFLGPVPLLAVSLAAAAVCLSTPATSGLAIMIDPGSFFDDLNLDFERGARRNGFPARWGGGGEGYELTADAETKHTGQWSGKIESVGPGDFGSLTNSLNPSQVAGKRIRYSGFLKAAEITGYAGLWLRADADGTPVAFYNMSDREIRGTFDWTELSFEIDVPRDVDNINFGALLAGGGTLWVDDLRFVLLGPIAVTSSHLLENGGFEDGSLQTDEPAGWYATRVRHTREHVVFAWDGETAHEGTRSVSIQIRESHPADEIHYNWNRRVRGYEVGETYELRGWIKTENLEAPGAIVVQCWDETRTEMLGFGTTQRDDPITGTTDWTMVETTFSIPEGTADVIVLAVMVAPANRGGKIWFDDITIVKATP